MSVEFIWFKNGRESRRTLDPEGGIILSEKLPEGVEVKYEYEGSYDTPAEMRTYKNGDLHSSGGEPAVELYNIDGGKHVSKYYKHGKLHRVGKPSVIFYFPNGVVKCEKFYQNGAQYGGDGKPLFKGYFDDGSIRRVSYGKLDESGKTMLHRDGDKPAVVINHRDGDMAGSFWYKDGVKHRDGDKPAEMTRPLGGRIGEDIYYINGVITRSGDKPSIIEYTNGKKYSETYTNERGGKHRDGDKPAYIEYQYDGVSIEYEDYYKNGVEYEP